VSNLDGHVLVMCHFVIEIFSGI